MKRYENMPTNKSFGIIFAIIFFVIGLSPLAFDEGIYFSFLFLSLLFLLSSLLTPRILTPFNYIWFRFGLIIHSIVGPILLGIIFFTLITFTGVLMRLLGKKPLITTYDHDAPTYWVNRSPPGPLRESLSNQF